MPKKAEEAAASIIVNLIGMVKTNTRVFCKYTIEGLTKDCPVGSYIVLRSKPMVPGERRILVIPYLSKYPNQFYNVSIRFVACPLLMCKFLGLVIDVGSHNKSRQLDLLLEKSWVTQCGWLRLCTTVDMGTTITNFSKLFLNGVKRDHYDFYWHQGILRTDDC